MNVYPGDMVVESQLFLIVAVDDSLGDGYVRLTCLDPHGITYRVFHPCWSGPYVSDSDDHVRIVRSQHQETS